MRPQIARIIRDLQERDEDIATYAAMNILRLKEIREDEILSLTDALRTATTNDNIAVRFFSKKALNEVKLQIPKFPKLAQRLDQLKEDTKTATWQDLLEEVKRADVEKKLVILDLLKDIDDPQILPALVAYLSTEKNEFVLAEIIKILGFIGKEELIPTLEGFLTHKDSRIRSNVAEALEEIGGKMVVKSLVPLLEDNDNRVKATVAKIISKHGETNVLHTVAKMLRSVEIWMRESATYALRFIPYQEAVDLLLEAMVDVNPEVQKKALEAITHLRPKKAIDYVSRLASSGDPALVHAARETLSKISQEPVEYPYFDAESEMAKNPGYLRQVRGDRSSRKFGAEEAPLTPVAASSPVAKAKTFPFSLFARSETKKRKIELEALERARTEAFIEMGKRALMLFHRGEIDLGYLREFDNEVKKLYYLIEQKESHRKEMKDESVKTTFISFLKDSVYRFTAEKRVENRLSSLQGRLLETYAELGRRVMQDYSSTNMGMVNLDSLPILAAKLTKQIDALQKTMGLAKEKPSQASVPEAAATTSRAGGPEPTKD